jgi:uncharacterized membrane protein YgdD (TMEM256/DUF423 family)
MSDLLNLRHASALVQWRRSVIWMLVYLFVMLAVVFGAFGRPMDIIQLLVAIMGTLVVVLAAFAWHLSDYPIVRQ